MRGAFLRMDLLPEPGRTEMRRLLSDYARTRVVSHAIAGNQEEYFLSGGDEKKLKPMILKDIAEEIGMDISTVSRAVSGKYAQTPRGTLPLKYFFTSGTPKQSGGVASQASINVPNSPESHRKARKAHKQ